MGSPGTWKRHTGLGQWVGFGPGKWQRYQLADPRVMKTLGFCGCSSSSWELGGFMRAVDSYLKVYVVKLSWPVINVDGSAWHHEHHTPSRCLWLCHPSGGWPWDIWQYPSKCQVWFLFKGTTIWNYDWCFSPATQRVKKGKTRFVPSQFIGSPFQQHFQEDIGDSGWWWYPTCENMVQGSTSSAGATGSHPMFGKYPPELFRGYRHHRLR